MNIAYVLIWIWWSGCMVFWLICFWAFSVDLINGRPLKPYEWVIIYLILGGTLFSMLNLAKILTNAF